MFEKKYEKDPANPNLYRPKGGAQEFLFLKEDVEFIAPWDEKMSILTGGVLSISDRKSGDIYGIQRQEFNETANRIYRIFEFEPFFPADGLLQAFNISEGSWA